MNERSKVAALQLGVERVLESEGGAVTFRNPLVIIQLREDLAI